MLQEKLIQFAKAHGFEAIANMDGRKVAVFIPTWNVATKESGFEIEEVSTIREARNAFGY